jgi:hypothetical protein
MADDKLTWIETEGGPFILLPLERKADWCGVEAPEDDEDGETDYDRAGEFVTTVGVLDVGEGQALILGQADVTGFIPTDEGGVFVQRLYRVADDVVRSSVAANLAPGAGSWQAMDLRFDVGEGGLALFDSAFTYDDADPDQLLELTLAPGVYGVDKMRVAVPGFEAGFVRLRRV